MSWTDEDTIKMHLVNLDRFPVEYHDIRVRLDASGEAELPHKGLVTGSEIVKQKSSLAPTSESGVSLLSETWTQLSNTQLVPNQAVVADDDGLEQVYIENADYTVDWTDGKIRRIEGGSIDEGATVEVFYQQYNVLTKNVDYTIDYNNGIINLKAGGSLKSETDVWVDYELTSASAIDALIPDAIVQAEDKIQSRLKDDYNSESTDQGLISGATELTLAIVCRSLAARALSDGATAAEGRSRGWRELAVQYENAAWITLRPFMKTPRMSAGNRKSNTSWEWV